MLDVWYFAAQLPVLLLVDASYGQRSSTELLLSYGFMPEPGTNPYDSVLLEVRTSKVAIITSIISP